MRIADDGRVCSRSAHDRSLQPRSQEDRRFWWLAAGMRTACVTFSVDIGDACPLVISQDHLRCGSDLAIGYGCRKRLEDLSRFLSKQREKEDSPQEDDSVILDDEDGPPSLISCSSSESSNPGVEYLLRVYQDIEGELQDAGLIQWDPLPGHPRKHSYLDVRV